MSSTGLGTEAPDTQTAKSSELTTEVRSIVTTMCKLKGGKKEAEGNYVRCSEERDHLVKYLLLVGIHTIGLVSRYSLSHSGRYVSSIQHLVSSSLRMPPNDIMPSVFPGIEVLNRVGI